MLFVFIVCMENVYGQVTDTASHTSSDTLIEYNLCANELPLLWNGNSFYTDTSVTVHLLASSGQDSVVTMTLHVTPNPIGEINTGSAICAGDTLNLSIGYNANASVVLTQPTASHYDSQKIFLPDGISCPPHGTYYRSHAQFNDFVPGSVIQSANDIRFLRLKIEHSAIEDLRVTLVCPNGSSCKIIPDNDNDGWGSIPHNYFRINLGLANRQTDNLSCDSTLNPIGVPWNYVWSNNTDQGYQYASGTYSYCYEPANIHLQNNPLWDNSNYLGLQSYVIDSSDVANMSQIYHPLQSFSNLEGCPLNGDWYIQVEDLQEQDNGYLVEWELSFAPSLLRVTPSHVASRDLTGAWSARTSDSTFVITPPTNLTHDTIVTYTVTVEDSSGCSFDTTFTVQFHAHQTVSVHDTILQNELPHVYNGHTFPIGSPQDSQQIFHLTSIHGCDSTVNYYLHLIPNDTIYLHDTVCDHELPYAWHEISFTQTGTQSQTFTNILGADSVVFLTLHVNLSDTTNLTDALCQGEPYDNFGFTLSGDSTQTSSTFQRVYTNAAGCDSTVILTLTVHPNTFEEVDIEIWENQLPYTFLGEEFYNDTTGVVRHLPNANGCDSTITFSLLIHRNIQITILKIYLPNAITPGIADGLNDYFLIPQDYLPQIADRAFSITIFNQLGEIVFYSTDKHFQWDGTAKGKLHRNSTYNYIIRYLNIYGEPLILKGSITTL